MLILVLRTAVILLMMAAALSMAVTVIRYAICIMIAVLILLKSVHVSKNSHAQLSFYHTLTQPHIEINHKGRHFLNNYNI